MTAVNPGADLDFANGHAVELGFRLDIHITDADVQEPTVAQLDVRTDVTGQSPAVTQVQINALQWPCGLLAEEVGVVQANADIGLEYGIRRPVVLDADGGGQLFGGTDFGAVQ
jgi:hypothetical protein